jgi:excisionase family DNA binding protein
MNLEPLTMTVPQAAKLLGVSRGTAYQGVKDGSIPALKIAGRIVVPRAKLLDLLGEPDPSKREPDLSRAQGSLHTTSDAESTAFLD